MKIEAVGSFLPSEILTEARMKHAVGLLDSSQLSDIEDDVVRDMVERQVACGVPVIAAGELCGLHWARNFGAGLVEPPCDDAASGSDSPPADHPRLMERIVYNPLHPLFRDFIFLRDAVAGRALCRQLLPSPANLLLELFSRTGGHPERLYPSPETLVTDIAEAYHLTLLRLHELGCASVLFDDTACGRMCDDGFTDRLLRGGVDIIGLQRLLIEVINASVEGLPDGMETAVSLSGGGGAVPKWEPNEYPGNIMPEALGRLRVDAFFLPFVGGSDRATEVLRHVPRGKKVVLGLVEAQTPFPDDTSALSAVLRKAMRYVGPDCLCVSSVIGLGTPDCCGRGEDGEERWRRLSELVARY